MLTCVLRSFVWNPVSPWCGRPCLVDRQADLQKLTDLDSQVGLARQPGQRRPGPRTYRTKPAKRGDGPHEGAGLRQDSEAGPGRGDPRSHPGWVRPSAESAGIQATSPGYHVGTPGMLVGFIPMPAGACPRTSAAAHRRAGQANRRVQPRMQVRVAAKRLGLRTSRAIAAMGPVQRRMVATASSVRRRMQGCSGPARRRLHRWAGVRTRPRFPAGCCLARRRFFVDGRKATPEEAFKPGHSFRHQGDRRAKEPRLSQGQVIAADDGRDQAPRRSLRAMVRPRILPCLSLVLSAATALTAGTSRRDSRRGGPRGRPVVSRPAPRGPRLLPDARAPRRLPG